MNQVPFSSRHWMEQIVIGAEQYITRARAKIRCYDSFQVGIASEYGQLYRTVGRQKELEEAVIKAEKLAVLGQLTAGLVHEIRNPLTSISGFLQLLQEPPW